MLAIGAPARSSLAQLLERNDIWTGACLARQDDALTTGFSTLDAELPGGGWPRGALIDILHQRQGMGELTLLLPALSHLTAHDEWVMLLAPPWRLFAPAWAAAGVALSRLIVVNASDSGVDDLWAAEQALRAGSISAVLMWLPARVETAQIRRLQLAAEAGGSCGFFMQDERRLGASSPAPLRLHLMSPPAFSPSKAARVIARVLAVRLVKRRGAPLDRLISLTLPMSPSVNNPSSSPASHALDRPLFSATPA